MQRNVIVRVAGTVAAAAAVIATFLPWLRSGTRRRNSYEIFSLVDRLGISQSSIVGWGLRMWPLAPLLLVAASTLLWFPRKWLGGACGIVAVMYIGGVAAAVEAAPASSLIAVEIGPWVVVAGTVILAICSLLNRQ